jgi:ABC-type branched-subunit amino acid transport system ATPase component
MTGEPLLNVRGLRKAFGGLVAVRDISFAIPHGSITGLIGPNGSGKTTVLNLITGELAADSGSVPDLSRPDRPHVPARARAAAHDDARERDARPHVRRRADDAGPGRP